MGSGEGMAGDLGLAREDVVSREEKRREREKGGGKTCPQHPVFRWGGEYCSGGRISASRGPGEREGPDTSLRDAYSVYLLTWPEQSMTSPYATLRATTIWPTPLPLSSSSKLGSPLALTCGGSRITHRPPPSAVVWLTLELGRESVSRTTSPGLASPKTVAGWVSEERSTMLSLKRSDGRTVDTASESRSAASRIIVVASLTTPL